MNGECERTICNTPDMDISIYPVKNGNAINDNDPTRIAVYVNGKKLIRPPSFRRSC